MQNSICRTKSFTFALSVIEIYKELVSSKKEYVMSRQLLKSGTSIGANIAEGIQAQSKPDFIHKYSIALKEAQETLYWLELLFQSKYIELHAFHLLKEQNIELIKLLTSSIKTAKDKG
ncbi:MAG: four helix bundle protein [Bacteroidota bacterium]|nr:four helix bundle protein [Bacteroidota bacterium]